MSAGGFSITRNAGNGLPESISDSTFSLTRTFNGYGEVEAQDYTIAGNTLTSFDVVSQPLPDNTDTKYIHDPLGRRIANMVNGAITEKYLWQGLIRLLAVYDGSNNLLMRFEYADARMPMSMTKNGSTYYLTYDQVGSLRIDSDASVNVIKRVDYDSFGNIINDNNPAFSIPFGFAGGLHDRDTGLVRFRFRDYDPDVGRWTAKDPILFAGGDTDLYGYCINDPVNWIDPWGLYWEYLQSTGQITHVNNQTGDRTSVGTGYAGACEGLNNPGMQNVPFVGPIPQGSYDIEEATTTRGPLTLPLPPQPGNDTFGRDAFRIHGDNSRRDQSASKGCIVTGRNAINQLNNSQDRALRVVS